MRRFSQWKWLRPGMGVKPLVGLLAVRSHAHILAVTGLPRISGVWSIFERLRTPAPTR